MKIIVSHDVDHLRWGEHWLRDAYIPKYLLRHTRYLCRRSLPSGLWWRRVVAPFGAAPLSNLRELAAFDHAHGVPATFFVGVSRGMGMSYGAAAARPLVDWLRGQGFAVGVHGIAFRDALSIGREYAAFREVLPVGVPFGVRNHYLRRSAETLRWQAAAGYAFDASEEVARPPYITDGICEFPVSLMESRLLREDGAQELQAVQAETERQVGEGERRGWSHFSILYHDVYHGSCFPLHRAWYEWLISWLQTRFEFESYEDAAPALRRIGGGEGGRRECVSGL